MLHKLKAGLKLTAFPLIRVELLKMIARLLMIVCRTNAFELRAVDGTSTGVIHCEDAKVLDQWVRYISTNITQLNNKSIKMSNKFLHPSELVSQILATLYCRRIRIPLRKFSSLLSSGETRFLLFYEEITPMLEYCRVL